MSVASLNDDVFIETINEHQVSLVEFGAEWCGPCKMQYPVLVSISDEYSDLFTAKVDIDASPKMTEMFSIQSVPTLILFYDGIAVKSHTGAIPKAKVKEFIKEWV